MQDLAVSTAHCRRGHSHPRECCEDADRRLPRPWFHARQQFRRRCRWLRRSDATAAPAPPHRVRRRWRAAGPIRATARRGPASERRSRSLTKPPPGGTSAGRQGPERVDRSLQCRSPPAPERRLPASASQMLRPPSRPRTAPCRRRCFAWRSRAHAGRSRIGIRNPVEPVHQNDDIGRLRRCACAARAHRDADVGGGERWRVVDPVTDHQGRMQALLDRHGVDFVGWHPVASTASRSRAEPIVSAASARSPVTMTIRVDAGGAQRLDRRAASRA